MTRFAVIGPTYPYRGGIAHYTTLLTRHLRKEGHEVLLVSFSRQYPKWLFPGKSDKDPSERPLQTEAEYLLDGLNPMTWWRTIKRLRAWQPDVVVMQWWVPYWAPAWTVLTRAVKRLPNSPRLVVICHNVLPHEQGRLQRVLPFIIRLAIGQADSFVLHSQADAQVLKRILPSAAAQVAPLPTYANLADGADMILPFALPDDRPLLLFAGFVRPYKGLDILIEALPLVLAKMPVHLLAAGEFWQGSEMYQKQIERLDIGNAVTIVDKYLPDEMLVACMRRADVVVLPYRSATQSAVVQMAFGQGTPVITTNVGGLGEVVANGRTGLVVPPEDPQALAAAICRYFREEMGERMRGVIQQENGRFSWDALIDRLKQLSETNDQGKDCG